MNNSRKLLSDLGLEAKRVSVTRYREKGHLEKMELCLAPPV